MIKSIGAGIFDIDGTLLDSSLMWEELGAQYLKSKGFSPAADLQQKLSALSLDEGAALLSDHYTKSGAASVKSELCGIMERFYCFEVQLKCGAKELVDKLCEQGIPLAVATAGNADLARAALERLGMWSAFAGIADCSKYGAKSSADVFIAAAKLCGAAPNECIVFEDSLHAVISAKRAGFFTAAVCDCSEPRQIEISKTAHIYKRELADYIGLFGK